MNVRRLSFESLEKREVLSATSLNIESFQFKGEPQEVSLAPNTVQAAREEMFSSLLNPLNPKPEAFITTTQNSANYITPVGTPLDGVVEIIVGFSSGTARASGTLLPTGRHILTAAHIFYDDFGNFATGAAVNIHSPTGTPPFSVFAPQIHPSYTGNLLQPGDIAVMEIVGVAPDDAERFDIWRSTGELGQVIEKVGYGRSGTGLQGSILASGTKRDGSNVFDAFGEALNNSVYGANAVSSGTHLVFDFDSGNAANDAGGFYLGIHNLGLGTDEVSTAPGDSGGPAFLDGLIAGVTSFGQGFNGTTDVLAGTNSSFGEFAVDTRVSTYAPWIDSIIDVPGLPTVTEVIVSGLISAHDPFPFSSVAGSGLQLRTVPVGGADTVSIQFSEHVIGVDESSLFITGLANASLPTLAMGGFSYDVGTHTANWRFDAPFDADQYYISLTDSITDVGSNALDGEWMNPFSVTTNGTSGVSTFPSGNGVAGGDFNFVFTILPGDGNLSNTVDGRDYLLYQRSGGGPGREFTDADYNGDGYTNSADNAFWQTNYGMDLTDLVFADFNGDGVVDNTDYGLWLSNQGTGTTHGQGDADGDGDVDIDDWDIWDAQFGLELDWVA